MAKRRGFVIRELMLYLCLGTVLLAVNLNLFRAAWLTYRTMRRIHAVKGDFLIVSERIKYDLLRGVHDIGASPEAFSFAFPAWAEGNASYQIKDYRVVMEGGRLVYSIYTNNARTSTYLSSLVKAIRVAMERDLLTVTFDYGDYQFQRSYRLDHIQTQRFPDGLHDPPVHGLRHDLRHPVHDRRHGFHKQCHRLA